MASDPKIDTVAEWSALKNERFAAPDLFHLPNSADEPIDVEIALPAVSESAAGLSAPEPSASGTASESDGPVPLRWTVAPDGALADVVPLAPHDDRDEETVSASQVPDAHTAAPATDDHTTGIDVTPPTLVSEPAAEASASELSASDTALEGEAAILTPVSPEGTVAAKRARTRVFHDDFAETSASAEQPSDEPAELRATDAVLLQRNGSQSEGSVARHDRTLEADRDHWRERAVIWHERAVAAELVVTVLQRHVDDLRANLEDLRLAFQASLGPPEEHRALTLASSPWRHFVEELRAKYFADGAAPAHLGTNGSAAPEVRPDTTPATADRLPPEEYVRS